MYTSKTHETKGHTTQVGDNRCVAIITRQPNESNFIIGLTGVKWGLKPSVLAALVGENSYGYEDIDIYILCDQFLSIYRNHPNRVSFDSKLEIRYNENVDESAKYADLSAFTTRLCIEFNMTNENLKALLDTDPNQEWHGQPRFSPEKNKNIENQLKNNASFARFEMLNPKTNQWVTYIEISSENLACKCSIF